MIEKSVYQKEREQEGEHPFQKDSCRGVLLKGMGPFVWVHWFRNKTILLLKELRLRLRKRREGGDGTEDQLFR